MANVLLQWAAEETITLTHHHDTHTKRRKDPFCSSSSVRRPSLCVLVPLYARKFTTDASLTSSWDTLSFGGAPKVEVSLCAPYGPPRGPPVSVSASSASCQCHTRKRTIPFPFSPSLPSVMSAVRSDDDRASVLMQRLSHPI